MDIKIFLGTFSAVFLAELADKTQLVGIGMASKTGKLFSVWLGSVSAYIVVTAFSVVLGALAGRYIRPEVIRYAAAVLFILIGVLVLTGKL